jgi:HlyD family secretion protein
MRIAGVEPAASEAGRSGMPGRIYVLDAKGLPRALPVRLGVSDGSMTELLQGGAADTELAEGAEVLVGSKPAAGGNGAKPGGGPRPPF